MASADATVFGVKGQALRVYGCIKDSTTGNPLDISAATMTATWSQDGTNSSNVPTSAGSAYGTITKVTGHTGHFYVDIIAASNDFYHISMTIASNASNSVSCTFDITNTLMSEESSAWSAQTVKRLEQAMLQGVGYSMNKVVIDNTSGALTVYKRDGTTVWFTGTASDDGSTTTKGTLS